MSSPLHSHFSREGFEAKSAHMPISPRSHSSESSQSSPPTSPDSPKSSGVLLQESQCRQILGSGDMRDLPLALARDGGFVTQLIPADELPYDLVGIPRVQSDKDVWVITKRERGAGYIMAPQHNGHTPNTSRALTTTGTLDMQDRIDEIISATPVRRPKIYCDKWIHEGVCAFTQQGCRFKHEMPLDRVTQQSLGLLGLPQWYKNRQAVELRAPLNHASPTRENVAISMRRAVGTQRDGVGSSNASQGQSYSQPHSQGNIHATTTCTWRRRENGTPASIGAAFDQEKCGLPNPGFRVTANANEQNRTTNRFGPIAPPTYRSSSNSPFSMWAALDLDCNDEEE